MVQNKQKMTIKRWETAPLTVKKVEVKKKTMSFFFKYLGILALAKIFKLTGLFQICKMDKVYLYIKTKSSFLEKIEYSTTSKSFYSFTKQFCHLLWQYSDGRRKRKES